MDELDLKPDDPGGSPIFTCKHLSIEKFGISSDRQPRISCLAAANGTVLAGFKGGELIRYYAFEEDEHTERVEFGREKCTDFARILLDSKGFHALATNPEGDTWYLNFQSTEAKLLPKLKGHTVESVSWDLDSNENSTRDLLVGTIAGQIVHLSIENSKERVVRPLFEFDSVTSGGRPTRVCGVHRERIRNASDGSDRVVVFAAAGCGVYAFIGATVETAFQKYQGAAQRALVFEVPQESVWGDLQVDSACVGPPSRKVLFWLTGVGVLAATIKDPLEGDKLDDTVTLESPPGLIPFPRSNKTGKKSLTGGSLVASLLPPPPPTPPLSMALTKYHIIFLFEDRWAAVSRITHEVAHQQEMAHSYGSLRGLVRERSDIDGKERWWLCSERHLFEVMAADEERSVWKLLLKLGQFEDALAACQKTSQRTRVLSAHADWLYKQGRLVESARKYAKATAVAFEHVALRFLGADNKAAFLEYLRERLKLCSREDKVTRALLAVWAVEISLAHLNDLQLKAEDSKGRSALDLERTKLIHLLKDCGDLDVHPVVYHMLQSHGWLQELATYAEERRDLVTVMLHHISRRDCKSAVAKLGHFCASGQGHDVLCRFAPILFGMEPHEFVTLLLRPQLASVDPLSVLPAVYTPRASTVHQDEAVRYLEHALQHHAQLLGEDEGKTGRMGRLRAGSLLPDTDLVGAAPEDASGCTGWASGTAVLNALTVLYAGQAAAEGAQDAEDKQELLLRFLNEQQENSLLDAQFALRVCTEKGLSRAAVLLYSMMGMHEEAVESALKHGDFALAQHSACKPLDKRLQRKLWLKIVEKHIHAGNVSRVTSLLRDSQVLSVRDILPFMDDSVTIEAIQDDIRDCLCSYEDQITMLRQEMEEHRRALQSFKKDLKQAEQRSVVIAEDQVCEICEALATKERFYVFACAHCFHEACLRALIVPTLNQECHDKLMSLEAMRLQHQAAAAGAASGPLPSRSLVEVEDELDGILADDCPLCGRLMIQTITRPFVDPGEEGEEESWLIG